MFRVGGIAFTIAMHSAPCSQLVTKLRVALPFKQLGQISIPQFKRAVATATDAAKPHKSPVWARRLYFAVPAAALLAVPVVALPYDVRGVILDIPLRLSRDVWAALCIIQGR